MTLFAKYLDGLRKMTDLTTKEHVEVECGACGHAWVAAYIPMEMGKLGRLLKGLHCPSCGESSKGLFLHADTVFIKQVAKEKR